MYCPICARPCLKEIVEGVSPYDAVKIDVNGKVGFHWDLDRTGICKGYGEQPVAQPPSR